MSINYIALPVDDEIRCWGRELGLALPSELPAGRYPSTPELLAAMESLAGHEITNRKLDDPFNLTMESLERVPVDAMPPFQNTDAAASLLTVSGHLDPDAPRKLISLHGDYDLIVRLLQQLTSTCGPLCFCADCDGQPIFVISAESEPIGPV